MKLAGLRAPLGRLLALLALWALLSLSACETPLPPPPPAPYVPLSLFDAETPLSLAGVPASGLWIAAGSAGVSARSTDDGLTWSLGPVLFEGQDVNRLATDGDGIWIALGNAGRLARSADEGLTWDPVTWSAEDDLPWLNGAGFGNGVFLVTGAGGRLLRSTDLGLTWTEIDTGRTEARPRVAFGNGVWLLGGSESSQVLRSTDGGLTWTAVSVGHAAAGLAQSSPALGFGTPTWMAASGGAVSISTDGGLTWIRRPDQPLAGSLVVGLDVRGTTWMLATAEGGLAQSTNDGSTWSAVGPLTETRPYAGQFQWRGLRLTAGRQALLIGRYTPNGAGVLTRHDQLELEPLFQ